MGNKPFLKKDDKLILKAIIQESLNDWKMTDSYGDQYLNRQKASEFLDVSEPTFDKLRREGYIPEVVMGSIVRYRKSDLLNIGKPKSK